ncbi:hypothetical protein TVD_05135 [Thioalkalivibrio versutus]|uniref:Uncharacterized protein n=1 Tax=Thioalkalivibrio versutus TaxID=106634 RepID=A0A0G3G316_9GAMM|nr:hypothetical protein TVD_05135 [Thioalkalivibrio versutus]
MCLSVAYKTAMKGKNGFRLPVSKTFFHQRNSSGSRLHSFETGRKLSHLLFRKPVRQQIIVPLVTVDDTGDTLKSFRMKPKNLAHETRIHSASRPIS